MHNISGNIFVLCAAALISTSCLSSGLTDDGQGAISFVPVLGTEVRSGDTVPFPEDMDFGVWAITGAGEIRMDCVQVNFDGTSWSPVQPVVWPDCPLRFIAIAPYRQDIVLKGGNELSLDEYDLSDGPGGLYVTELTPEYSGTDGAVYLPFRRATAMLDFRVANGMNTATSVRLEKIIIEGVYVQGSFSSASDPEWTLAGDPVDLTAYDCETDGGNNALTRSPLPFGKTMEIIPQQSHPVVEVVYSFRTADSEWLTGQSETTSELKAEWEPGRHYTYTLTLTGNMLKHTSGISTAAGM